MHEWSGCFLWVGCCLIWLFIIIPFVVVVVGCLLVEFC